MSKKKLIEVALPLEAINTESAREKSIRHGHPSTLHLWWARRGQVQRGGVRLIRRGQAVRACGMGWSVASWVVVVAWDLARTSRPR